MKQIKELAKDIINKLEDLKNDKNEIKRIWKSNKPLWQKLLEIGNLLKSDIEIVVMEVEKLNINLTSDEKLELASEVLDQLIKFSFFIELVDKKIFQILICLLVDFLNKKFGKNWLKQGGINE